MNPMFVLCAIIAVVGVVAAMTLRNPIHCILSVALGLVGIAGLYLALGAQFVGFTQVLVYVGAVAILAVFALMMTRAGEIRRTDDATPRRGFAAFSGVFVAVAVFWIVAFAVVSFHPAQIADPTPTASAKEVGVALLHRFSVPLEIVGVLLTAALIGAVVVALPEEREIS